MRQTLLRHALRAATTLLPAAGLLWLGLAGSAFAQQPYPKAKPVTLIVPYPAGGPSDAGARALSGPLGEALGQAVVVENQGGATGALAANNLMAAPADGYRVFYGSPNEVMLSPLLNGALKFKPEDFTLVHPLSTSTLVLVARPDLQADSLDEFIGLARRPGAAPLNYGSVGIGSLYHLIVEYMGRKLNVPFNHVPYKGAAPVLADLAGSQIDFALLPYQASMDGLVKQGRMKIVSSLSRSLPPALKHLKTVGESRLLHDFEFTIWGGNFVKKGTPEDAVTTLREATLRAMASPEVRKRLENEGRIPYDALSKEQIERLQQEQTALYRAMIKTLDFKIH